MGNPYCLVILTVMSFGDGRLLGQCLVAPPDTVSYKVHNMPSTNIRDQKKNASSTSQQTVQEAANVPEEE